MPPYAICCTDQCDYVFDCEDSKNLPTLFPARRCPTCRGRLILYCRFCGSTILEVPGKNNPFCGNCSARLRDTGNVPEVSNSIIANSEDREDTQDNRVVLSRRELDVLKLLATGNGNKEVASVLGISPKTVECYRSRVMLKINARSLTHLVHYAIRHRIVELQR
jgi:DNA-binding CsgD family transcriptional regulator